MRSKDVTNQHYVPRFYLKKFANSDNELERFDAERRILLKPKGPSGICKEDYFYALESGQGDEISQAFEAEFKKLEDSISRNYQDIVEQLNSQHKIEEFNKNKIAELIAMLWTRVPAARKQMTQYAQQLHEIYSDHFIGTKNHKEMLEMIEHESGKQLTDKDIEEINTSIKQSKIEINNGLHLNHIARFQGYANTFYNKNMRVYIAKGSRKFITSDNPVYEWIADSTVMLARSILLRRQFLALTPEIMVESFYSPGAKSIKRRTLFDNEKDNWVVQWFNLQQGNFATAQCYSHADHELLLLKEYANGKRFNYSEHIWFKEF